MSLVNDMLQDLEDRQGHDRQKAVGASSVIARQYAPMSRGSKLSLAIGLGLILLAAALWSWHNRWWQPSVAPLLSQQTVPIPPEEGMPDIIPAQAGIHTPSQETNIPPEPNIAQEIPDTTAKATIEPEPQAAPEPTVAQKVVTAPAIQPTESEPAPQQPLPEAEQLAKTVAQSVTPSASTLDQKAADTARQLIGDGQTQRARRLLETHLQQYPKAVKSTMVLAKLHTDSGDYNALDALLAATPALQPAQISLLQAQSLLARGQADQAMGLLEKNPPGVEQHPDYHALLAGLYHKSGKHRAAATLYSSLVNVQRENPVYWLGLAVALDALQDRNALQAFRRTHTLNENPNVQAYIEQRIAALSDKR